jgi:hypothetical protein
MLRSSPILKRNGARFIRKKYIWKRQKKIHSTGLNVLNIYLRTSDLHQIWRLETLQIMDHIPKRNWNSKVLYSCFNFSKIQF